MPVGKKKSPAKFMGAAAMAVGIIKGVTTVVGGIQRGKRERDFLEQENKLGEKQYDDLRRDLKRLEVTNPYKDLPTTFENTYEDMTVNQQQAQFQAQQGAQARANLLSNLRGAAGSSGIAGLAQALANQQQTQTQQISANIGQQEAVNQRLRAQGAAGVQQLGLQAKTRIGFGEGQRQTNENLKQMNLMNLQAGRYSAEKSFRNQMLASQQAQNQAVMGGIGDIVGAGVQGYAAGGGFTEDGFSMDTLLGRESLNNDSNDYSNDGNILTKEGDSLPPNPSVGDFAKIDGVMKQWDGSQWVQI